jgi:hypothetical protein
MQNSRFKIPDQRSLPAAKELGNTSTDSTEKNQPLLSVKLRDLCGEALSRHS